MRPPVAHTRLPHVVGMWLIATRSLPAGPGPGQASCTSTMPHPALNIRDARTPLGYITHPMRFGPRIHFAHDLTFVLEKVTTSRRVVQHQGRGEPLCRLQQRFAALRTCQRLSTGRPGLREAGWGLQRLIRHHARIFPRPAR